jgi:hypothetical protein
MRIKEITITETTWQDLYALNRDVLSSGPDKLRIGMELVMPDDSIYRIAAGDNLSKIAAGQGKGTRTRRNSRTGEHEPVDPRDAEAGRSRGSGTQAVPTKTTPPPAKQGPAPDGSILKAANIPWRKAGFPHYEKSDMVKRNGQWWSQPNGYFDPKATQATQPAWIDQLEQIWANSIKG